MITIITQNRLILTLTIIILLTASFTVTAVEEPCWENLKKESLDVLEDKPKDIRANYDYIIALVNMGEIKQAYNTIDKFGEEFNINQFKKQISPYFKELVKVPNDILILNYTAFYGVVTKEYDISIRYFKRILELTPDNYNIRNFLAASYVELENYDLAFKETKRALNTKDNEFSHLLLGVIYYEQGNVFKAVSEFAKSGSLGREILNNN